ncbi:MAG: hypothetical protein ABI382_03170 [Nakamurella sp.]
MPAAIDFSAGYSLAPDLVVFRRNDTTIQIGTEAPRRVLIANVPPHASSVLRHLHDTSSLSDAIAILGGDPERWKALFCLLADEGLLEPSAISEIYPPHLTGERLTLIHRFGRLSADRALAARADAIVVIEGSGLVADLMGGLLEAAGIGRIHQSAQPGATGPKEPPTARRLPHTDLAGRPTLQVRYRPPASQTRPNITVLAGPRLPTPGRVAALITQVVPHLPIQVTSSRLIVGPLVLPGLSTCINCIDRHRLDLDPDWHTVAAAAQPSPQPSTPLAQSAASLAAGQVLDLIDALRKPASVNATLEQLAGSIYPRRRAWSRHDECRCRHVAHSPTRTMSLTTDSAGI